MIEGKRNIRVIIATGDLLNYELSISKAQNKRGDISHFTETEKIHSSQTGSLIAWSPETPARRSNARP